MGNYYLIFSFSVRADPEFFRDGGNINSPCKLLRVFEKRIFKIVGSLFNFQNCRYIRSFKVSVVDDLNEISHHLLESLFISLKFSRGPISLVPTIEPVMNSLDDSNEHK